MGELTENDATDPLGGVEAVQSRLGDSVIKHLTKSILDGGLKVGDSLPSEGRIASAFGVNKQVAREALRELAAFGVVQIQQGKATRVREVDAAPLERFYQFVVAGSETGLAEAIELRRILEPPIARLAAHHRTEEQLVKLYEVLKSMEQVLGDAPAWIETDLDFHEALANACGNRLLRFQLHGLRPLIREVAEVFNTRRILSKENWQRTLARHTAIVEAVKNQDGDAASEAMLVHFESSDRAIREIYPKAPSPR